MAASDCVQRHRVLVMDRGGTQRLSEIVNIASVEWGRAVGRKTQATVVVSGRYCSPQAAALAAIEPRRHELAVFRGSERVWEGPIAIARGTSSRFEIVANDVLDYVDHRALTKPWPSPENGGQPLMVDRIRDILEYELATDYVVDIGGSPVTIPAWESLTPPINVLPHLDIRPGPTRTYSDTEAFEMTIGEHLYNLGRSKGVSYAAVGRSIVIWDGSIGRLRIATEADFAGDLEVISDGADFFNVAHVTASNQEVIEDAPDELVVGHGVNDLNYYGPWERVATAENEETTDVAGAREALETQAVRSLVGRYPVPTLVVAGDGVDAEAALIPSPGLSINQLVPGIEIPIRARRSIRDVRQVQVLQSMRVSESVNGETVHVTLSPIGFAEEAS